ncbi:MAG: hypothetical protein ACE5PT_05030 [Gemmatimonadales bacterium]
MKLTAVLLAAVLWAATAAQEPTTQLVQVALEVQPPEGRALRRSLPYVQALFAGSTRELIKLFAHPPVIRKEIPDTVQGSEYIVELDLADLVVTGDANVTPQDVQPRMITVQLDALAQRTLPVVPRVRVRPDSGFGLYTGIAVAPSSLLVRGPEIRVSTMNALYTLPLEITEVRQPVRRSLAIDTTGLAPVRLSRYSVDVSADVGPISTRTLSQVPVEVRSERGRRWSPTPSVVTLMLRGATARLAGIDPDSVSVVAMVVGSAREQVVPLSVIAPPGISARPVPDSVVVRRR